MKTMITGSEGMIAQALAKRLNEIDEVDVIYGVNRKIGLSPQTVHHKAKPDKIHRVYTCLENEQFVRDLFKHVKPDLIFHLASSQGKDHDSYIDNVALTNNIVKYCPEGCRVIYLSSSTVYGDLSMELKKNNEHLEKSLGNLHLDYRCRELCRTIPTNLYGSSKVSSESVIQAQTSAGKINSSVILRPCAIVGSEASRGAIPDIIKKLKGEAPELELYGNSPGSVKPYLNIHDMVEALTFFGFSSLSGETYNISPADYVSIEEVANLLMKRLGIEKQMKWLGESCVPLGDNKLVCLDSGKALEVGFSLKYPTSLEAILEVLLSNEKD